jgi:hypothetical protein
MSNLSSSQFAQAVAEEERIRKKGLMNSGTGFVGNGFYWGMYPTYTGSTSGYGGYLTTAQNPPVSDSGNGASSTGDAAGSLGAGDVGGSGGF